MAKRVRRKSVPRKKASSAEASKRRGNESPSSGSAGEGQVAAATRRGEVGGAASGKGKASSLIDTRVIYCGDCLEQLEKLPDDCIDLIYIDPPFNSNRNYEVFWGETKEKRAFEDRHESTQAYIDYMRPRCVQASTIRRTERANLP